MFKNLTLKWKMFFGGMVVVAIPLVIGGAILYLVLSHFLLDVFGQRSVQVAKDMTALIDTTLRYELSLAAATAADPVTIEAADSGDYRTAEKEITAIHSAIARQSMTFFLADRHGIVRADAVFKDSVGVDLSDRPYFLAARNGKTSISGPLRARLPRGSSRSSDVIVVVSVPIMGKSGFAGIAASIMEIDYLVKTIASTRIGKTGYAYVMDSNGLILVHPKKEYILTLNIRDEPGMEGLVEDVMNKKTGVEAYTFRGTKKIAGFAPVELMGWSVGFTQNRDEIMEPVNSVLVVILIGGLTLIGLALSLMIFLSRRISMPVERAMELMEQVTFHSDDIILNIGLDRRIVFANPAAEKIMSSGKGSIIGTTAVLTNLNATPPEEIWKELAGGRSWTGLVPVTQDGSEPLTFTVIILPVRDRRGAIQSYLEIGKDLTNELMLESRLRQSQKMEALGSMAGGIAHDFNNILAGIYGYSELSLTVSGNPAKTEEYIREIVAATERARDLTRQILMFSRQATYDLKPLMPKGIVSEALKLIRASVPATIEIRSRVESDAVIMAEPTQLHQIIVNLSTNAVSAIGAATGDIEVTLEDTDVDEEYARCHPGLHPGRHVLLRVSDSGRGIDPSIIDRIFDPFFTTKPRGEGTGLGLSVVHGIVRRLGGCITVYSTVGLGTTFTILIPVAPGKESGAEQEAAVATGGSERILLVDDEQPIVSAVTAILTGLGYNVSGFTSSGEALEAFRGDPAGFDLVITDYVMPGKTGLVLSREIRGVRADIPIILCSGYFSKDAESEAGSIGIAEILTKPLSRYQLAVAIRKVLDERAGVLKPPGGGSEPSR